MVNVSNRRITAPSQGVGRVADGKYDKMGTNSGACISRRITGVSSGSGGLFLSADCEV